MLPTHGIYAKNNQPQLNHSTITICRYHHATLKLSNTSGTVKWKTSNKNIVTVSKKGTITGVMAGKATVTANYKDKNYKCQVTVKEYSKEISLAAYGYKALQNTLPNQSSVKINTVYYGTYVSDEPFACFDLSFKDANGKKQNCMAYIYEKEQTSDILYNIDTAFYESHLVLQFENQPMNTTLEPRVTKLSLKSIKNAAKIIFSNEKIKINKGTAFDSYHTWLSI